MRSTNMPKTVRPIQAYFSHSYKKEDREVNLAFWEVFSKEGFIFTVDPAPENPNQNHLFVIPYLEWLMKFHAQCFIAVVTPRKTITSGPTPQTKIEYSQYIAFENFLAELADKPRLVFVDESLRPSDFGKSDVVISFNQKDVIRTKAGDYKRRVQDFADKVRAYMSYQARTSNRKAGILLKESQDPKSYTKQLIQDIKQSLEVGQFAQEEIKPLSEVGLKEFLRNISELELIIMDVLDPNITNDTLAVIQAKAIPCIRIAPMDSGSSIETFKSRGLLKDYFVGDDIPVIRWESHEALLLELKKYINRFMDKDKRDEFDTFEKGKKYFSRAGRKNNKHKVFISNPDSLNPLAIELTKELDAQDIKHFQYKSDQESNENIKLGTDWRPILEQRLKEFDIFVALINNNYHTSQMCQRELEVAIERYKRENVTILPFLCGKTQYPDSIRDHYLQGKDLTSYSKDTDKIKFIVKQLDDELMKDKPKKEDTKMTDTSQAGTKKVSVFINHASEDKPLVRKLYETLEKVPWLDPWLDEKKILAGQNWDYEIDKAIKSADAVLICISQNSISKIGVVQAEIYKAKEMQKRRPYGVIYMIPVLLEKCRVPDDLSDIHWADITEPGKIDEIIKSLESLRK